MPNRPSKCPSEHGENPASESGTPATNARVCIDPENDTVPIVVKKGGRRLYEIRTYLVPAESSAYKVASTNDDRPKKLKPEFDPEVVRQVEERLAQMDFGV